MLREMVMAEGNGGCQWRMADGEWRKAAGGWRLAEGRMGGWADGRLAAGKGKGEGEGEGEGEGRMGGCVGRSASSAILFSVSPHSIESRKGALARASGR
jgi:hypothetical protein